MVLCGVGMPFGIWCVVTDLGIQQLSANPNKRFECQLFCALSLPPHFFCSLLLTLSSFLTSCPQLFFVPVMAGLYNFNSTSISYFFFFY